jgi:TatD DNase family protein
MTQEPKFFDAHTHVQFSGYDSDGDADRAAVLARAREAGVWMINVGTQIDMSRAAVELAEREQEAARRDGHGESGVFAAVGLHPVHTSQSHHDENELGGGSAAKAFTSRGEAFDIEEYRRLALHKRTVAIGECGLDYFRFNDNEPREEQVRKQKEAFIAQIQLSLDVKKPLMIHCRNAFADLIEVLNFYKGKFDNPGVIHFFTGSADDARALLDLGFSFTFGGAITFPPRKGKTVGDYDEVIKLIPADRILSETDAPYLAPATKRGKRNEPAYVVEVVQKLAELKNVSADEMKQQIWENARRIFKI